MKFSLKIIFLFLISLIHYADVDNKKDVEEVIIKGTILQSDKILALKTPTPISEVPQSVSIFTDLDIKDFGFKEISDLLDYTPGVTSSQGEGHRDAVVIRGIRSTADFFQDGVRDDTQYYRSLYNVEQVEILRGPNALLFGRGGTGGIINRVSKKALLTNEFSNFDIGIDTFGALDVSSDSNFIINENNAFRINFHIDSLANHRDLYSGKRFGLNPTIKILLTEKSFLDLSYELADHERFVDRGIPTFNGIPDEKLKDIVFGQEGNNIATLQSSIFKAHYERTFSNQKTVLTLQSNKFDKFYKNFYVSDYDGQFVTIDGYSDPTERSNVTFSINHISEFDTEFLNGYAKHTFLTGLEVMRTDSSNLRYDLLWSSTLSDKESFSINNPINLNFNYVGMPVLSDFESNLNSSTNTKINVSSLYLQDQIELTDNLVLMLGARIDEFDISVLDFRSNTSISSVDNKLSPRYGIVYKNNSDISYYYSYSESFLPRSGEQYKKLTKVDSQLDPDIFENNELGIKWTLSPSLFLTAAIFNNKQIIAARDNISGENYFVRGLSVDGYEIELKGKINDRFKFIVAGYSSLDGKSQTGGKPRELPEFMFSLYGQYSFNDFFGLGLGIIAKGETQINDDDPNLYLPDYNRIDLSAFYKISNKLIARMNIENLTDELYYPHAHNTHQVTVGAPFNAKLSLSYNF